MPGIVPCSGPTDLGADAELYESTSQASDASIIQISLQKTYREKIRKTAARVSVARGACRRIVFISNQDISAREVRALRTEIKSKHSIHLEVRDWRWVHAQLSDPKNKDLRPDLYRRFRESFPILPENEEADSDFMGYASLTMNEREAALETHEYTEGSALFGFKGPIEGIGKSALIVIESRGDIFHQENLFTRVFVGKAGSLRLVHSIEGRTTSVRLTTLDGAKSVQIILNIWEGGTGSQSSCCILHGPGFTEACFASNDLQQALVTDVDNDGVNEVLLATFTWASLSLSTAIHWYDVFKWGEGRLERCSEKCTEFYQNVLSKDCPSELRRFFIANTHVGNESFEIFRRDILAKAERALMVLAGLPDNYKSIVEASEATGFAPSKFDAMGITKPFHHLLEEDD
ncbi:MULTISPECIES: hypothetical protein [unclassified Corallococcus]|uniref:hypothetical protein n=1 Tax=unclassified Corallococcus TaxID=2685029 RepID=UPI000F865C69|nr:MULTISPECIES: hypothetical protein [unclassified Corallococcus]